MYNEDTNVLFPPRLIPQLRDLRGAVWRDLVIQVSLADPLALERLAFVLMMIRLGGCTTCSADSFRAMRGCTQCAIQTVKRYRSDDRELLKDFQSARDEVIRHQNKTK